MKFNIVLKKMLNLSLVLFMLLLPISRSGQSISIGLSVLTWILFALFGKTVRNVFKNHNCIINILALVFLMTLGIGIIINGVTLFSLEGLREILACVVFFFVIYQCVDEISKLQPAVIALLIGCVVACIHAVVRYCLESGISSLQSSVNICRLRGLLDTNSLAGVLEMAIPICLSLALFYRKNVFLWFGFLLMLICLGLTFTRGAWLGTIASISFVFYFYQRKVRILLLFFIFIIVTFTFWHSGQQRLLMTIINYKSESERITMWKYAVEMFKKRPFFGNGLNSFKKAIIESNISVSKGHKHCHNIYLGLAAEAGIVSLLSFLLLSLFGVVTGLLQISYSLNSWDDFMILGCSCLIISFLIHGFVDYTLYGETGYMYGFAQGAIAVYVSNKKTKKI